MKIVVASLGRAHLLDCARELQKQGHDVIFYSITPSWRFNKYGLNTGGKSLLKYAFLFYFLKRFVKNEWTHRLYRFVLDELVCFLMPKCDVFICQSPNYVKALSLAKKKYHALTILDRGSTHIKSFDQIAKMYGDNKGHSRREKERDERQYFEADYVTVASDFVLNTFKENGFDCTKIFVNQYGVRIDNFFPQNIEKKYDCIFVGQWCRLKGCELLIEYFIQHPNLKFIHVGAIGNLEFPQVDNMVHIDAIPEKELAKYYNTSRIFVFPSFNDGYGLVLNQAAACGLPIVCSQNCGGASLKEIIAEPDSVFIMDDFSLDSLHGCVMSAMNYTVKTVNSYDLTWDAYGKRYDQFLKRVTHNNGKN